jgi:hypothetical protein
MALQEIGKEGGHFSAIGAALSKLVGHVIGNIAGPTFHRVEGNNPNGIAVLSF